MRSTRFSRELAVHGKCRVRQQRSSPHAKISREAPSCRKFPNADRHRAAESGAGGSARATRARSSRRSARPSAPARASWSRPSSRCAAIRPRTCVLRPAFLDACARELDGARGRRAAERRSSSGFPSATAARATTRSRVLADGRVNAVYRKQLLPNYTVFDEERYFEPGNAPCVVDIDGTAVGLIICEDVWFPEPAKQAKEAGAQVIVVPNGSPYHTRQQEARREQVGARARETGLPVRLRQSRRRAGRARVRRRVVRHECRRRSRAAAAGLARDDGARDARRGRRAAAGARRARPAARIPRLRGAGDGRARLRRQEPVSRACCWGFPAASIPRWCSPSPSMRSGASACAR